MMNPILRKEIRTTFRSPKIFVGIGIYTLVLTSIMSLFVFFQQAENYGEFTPTVAAVMFGVVSGIQLFLIYVIVPAISGGAISGEKERQTLDILLMTKMKCIDIVKGKLMSSLMVVMLLLAASMPMYGIVFYYGGINIFGFLLTVFFLMAHAVYVGSMALYFSAKMKKGAIATILTYFMLIGINFITSVISNIVMFISIAAFGAADNKVFFNDIVPVIIYLTRCVSTSTSFMALIAAVTGVEEADILFYLMRDMSGVAEQIIKIIPLWLFNIFFVAAMGIIFIFVTSKALLPKGRR